ncbi:MAG: VWA domain-containing protein [Bacteroidota bacterium]|nr:VWA domain-containing protein [Bacteroidota bacterium]MDX5449255.1 VWA domain-containing protein [Bacteroidota bacterium]MDX5505239.1 VWA domain-containing protein [Bacteroidota bacterium]
MSDWTFLHPEWFWLLLILPLFAFWSWWTEFRGTARLKVPGTTNLGSQWPWRVAYFFRKLLRLGALGLVIMALARPQTRDVSSQTRSTEGVDIVLVTDISTSMLARDFRPNRLEALKMIAAEFVDDRPTDRIGLVVYAGESFGQVPLTTDHKVVKEALEGLQNGMLEDGTAIGLGLGTAVNRIRESDAKSKVIILLTDGVNNRGAIDPITAAGLAREYGVKVYTIGIGSSGMAEMPVARDFAGNLVFQRVPVEIDEKTLQEIADLTGGKYFRARGNDELRAIYEEIDQMEKSKIEELQFFKFEEKFYPLILGALALLVLEFLFRFVIMKSSI